MKRILSFIMTVSVIVSMLCIGTVPASAFDANQGNDVYFYSPPMRLSEVEFTEHAGNRKSFYLTYYLYVNPEKYWGTTGGNLIITINGGKGFIDFFNTRNPASSLSAVMLSTEPNPDDDPDAYTPMTFGTAEMQTWDKKYGDNLDSAILVDFDTADADVKPLRALQEGNPYGKEAGQVAEFKVRYMVTDYDAFVQAVNNKTLSFTVDIFTNLDYQQDLTMYLLDGDAMGKLINLQIKEYPAPNPENFQFTVDTPQPATDPYYNYTGDNANGYTITFTDAYKNAILSNTDYTSDDGATTYWSANDPIKNPQYNGKTVSSAANLFSGMALSKVDLSEFNLSDTAMSNMFAGFLGTGDGIPAIGIAADDATATKYNLTDTGIDTTSLYFGNVTILNYNDGNGYSYVYDNRATTDTDEATTAVTIGNAGNNKQFVNITGQYFAGFENPDRTDALVTIDYSDPVKTKDLDACLTTNQTSDKNNNVLRLLLNAKDNAPSGVNLSKAMAQRVTKNGTNSIRFIALIDTGYADYKETGFVLSGVGMNPTRQAGYQYKSVGTIYKKLRALDTTSNKPGVVLMDIEKMNGIFGFANGAGFEYTELKIPVGKENTTYYATPYIVLADDTIVYGETKATTFNILAENDQKSVQ